MYRLGLGKSILGQSGAFFCLFLLTGCGAGQYLGSTEASYEMTTLGPKLYYKSNKNQEGFSASVTLGDTGKVTGFNVSSTATTPESAIAAALQTNLELTKMLQAALAAASKGGSNASVIPSNIPVLPANP